MKPKIRATIQPQLFEHEGMPYVLLRDPLGLADDVCAVPQAIAPLLGLLDGSRDIGALRNGFELRTGISLGVSAVEQIVTRLDEVLLLDNGRFAQARNDAARVFRSTPCRLPALAGGGYPDDPEELEKMLNGYVSGVEADQSDDGEPAKTIRGIVSPHIDFQRGGPVYAQAWSQTASSIADIDLVIILGTDHFGGCNRFTLTPQNYATPWGILPTDKDIVSKLAGAIGEETAFADELHHKGEHSIELALIWLHYLLKDRQIGLVPILCGSFEPFMSDGQGPDQDAQIDDIVDILQQVSQSRRTLVVAAADLAHMGPAFGDTFPIDVVARTNIEKADRGLVKSICAGDADGFFAQIRAEQDRRRICGLAPIYMALRILNECTGYLSGYAQCPADEVNGSLVSICGVTLE